MENVQAVVSDIADKVKDLAVNATTDTKPQEPKEQKPKKEKKKAPAASTSDALELVEEPAFIKHRNDIFDRLKAQYDAEVAQKPREPITITLQDGSTKEGTSWETTPAMIAEGIAKSLLKKTVISRLDGKELWDLERPLERSCTLELLPFEHEEGKRVFWHSSAHILGECAEKRFGCNLCFGPPIEDGFYYEMALPGGAAVQQSDWKPLETIFAKMVKEKQKFERLELTKADLLDMFRENPCRLRDWPWTVHC